GSTALAVRPALHLNLKSAALSAASRSNGAEFECVPKPENLEFVYNGTEYTDLKTLVQMVRTGVDAGTAGISGVTKWYDMDATNDFHALSGGSASGEYGSDYLVSTGSAVHYKIVFTPQGKTAASDKKTLTTFSIKNAGKYEITCKLGAQTNDYKWRSVLTGAVSSGDVTFTITVKQKEIKYKWANSASMSGASWETTFNVDTFTPDLTQNPTAVSAAPWVYVSYDLGNVADNIATAVGYDKTTDKSTTTELLPCVVLKFVNSEGYDSNIEKIFARRDGVRGDDHPKEAGTYTVTFVDKNADTSNYKLVADAGEGTSRQYTIKPYEVDAPGVLSALEYNGQEQSFTVANYDKKYMEYGTLSGTTFTKDAMPKDSNNVDMGMTADTTSGLVLKAQKVGKYKIAYQLMTSTVKNSTTPIVRNYEWKTNATGKAAHEVEYEISAKKLGFVFTSDATNGSFTIKTSDKTSKLTYDYASGKGPVGQFTFDGTNWVQDLDPNDNSPVFDEPVLELWFYYDSDTNASDNPQKHTSATELKFNDLKALNGTLKTGNYTVYLKLADATANPVNKNYVIVTDDSAYTYSQAVEIKAGEASLDDIKQVYKDSTMGAADNALDLPFADGQNVKNLTYAWDANTKKAVEYFLTLDFTDIDFLEVAGPYTYKYSDGQTLGAGQGFAKADKVKVIVTVQIKSTEQATNKMPTEAEYAASAGTDGNKFTYTYIDATKGTLEFEYTIEKADVDATELAKNTLLQYRMGSSDSWHDYDPDNPPEYNGANIEVQVNTSKIPQGIDTWKIETSDYLGNRKGPGTITLTVHYTVKDNYNPITGNAQVYALEISSQIIDSGNWTTGFYTDGNGDPIPDSLGVPYQIYELSLDDPAFADFIKYEYYLADMNDPTNPQVGGFIGVGDAALADLTDPLGAYKASSSNPVPVYVKAVIDPNKVPMVNNNPKYVLKDSTGKDGYKLFSLGESKDLIKVTVLKEKSEYKDNVKLENVLEFKLEDGSTCPTSYYTLTVYKDKIDPANLIGDISGFDFSNADAGKYVIEITLTDPDSYACTKAFVNYTIEAKKVAVPTLKDMTFTGAELSLSKFLTGESWTTYGPDGMNIIVIGGIDAARDVHQGGYVATLTLTNTNYKWEYPETNGGSGTAYVAGGRVISAASKTAADNEVSVSGTDTQANLNWNVSPLVIDATNLWDKGKNGASLKLPQNVKDLISAGTLEVGYQYYDADGNFIESPEIKGGKSYNVAAVFAGQDSDLGNVRFVTKDANGEEQLTATTAQVPYTVPQSGMQAFGGKVLSFLKNYWWWILIALAILILLIILIVVIAKRRKNKEEREEKKRQKEEEKERKEEEKRRREEEREEEKRRREEEREREKAEREAE
ncbi:MAG: hypothetical protein K2G38_04485, partial [Clostridia bacterium]|nr:hypothetical protein [Clostridia bacterium]